MNTLTDNNPLSRFPAVPIEQACCRWWVAKVKPRQEKQLAIDLLKKGVEYYLPLYKKTTVRPGTNKKRISIVPLFPGYICFSQDIPKDIFLTGRVVNLIEIINQKRFVKELSAIYYAFEYGYSVEPISEPVMPNTKVEIISGMLKGIQGVVASIRNHVHLILEVGGLGRAAVQIEMRQVRILNP